MKKIGLRILFGASVLSTLALGGCEKYSLDARMEELCALDGGIKVLETVKLPVEKFDDAGEPVPGTRSNLIEERLGPNYQLIHQVTYIKKGDPVKGEGQLHRSHWTVVRIADEKILVSAVAYGRVGGDFIALGHFSSKGCPQDFGAPKAVIRAAFINTDGGTTVKQSEQRGKL